MADNITMIRGYQIPRGDKMDYAGYGAYPAKQQAVNIGLGAYGDFYRGPIDAPAPGVFAPIPPLDGYNFGIPTLTPLSPQQSVMAPRLMTAAPGIRTLAPAPSTGVPAIAVQGNVPYDPTQLCEACLAPSTDPADICCYDPNYVPPTGTVPNVTPPGAPPPTTGALGTAAALGVAGFFLGGPIGAAIGAAAGLFLKRNTVSVSMGSYNSKQFPTSRANRPVGGFSAYTLITRRGHRLRWDD